MSTKLSTQAELNFAIISYFFCLTRTADAYCYYNRVWYFMIFVSVIYRELIFRSDEMEMLIADLERANEVSLY